MKNKFNPQVLALCILTIFTALIAFSARNNPVTTVTYLITLEYDDETGTASASLNPAAKGKEITITAEPGANYKFKLWKVVSGGIILSSNITNPATFTMPANEVTIRAEFEAITDITLDALVYGYVQPAKKSVPISNLGLNTQTVNSIVMKNGNESPFVLDSTDINSKIAIGNVLSFFIQPKAGLKAGSYTDSVIITHSGDKTTVFDILITVSQKPVTISGLKAENKEYDGTTDAIITGTAIIEGLITGDDVVLSNFKAVFEDKNVGNNKTVLFSDYTLSGADADNYIFSQLANIKANISPRSVNVNITNPPSGILMPFGTADVIYEGKTYRQNITLNLNVTGIISGEAVTVIVSNNVYGLSGSTEVNGISGTLSVYYNGTIVNQTTPVSSRLEVSGNYQLAASSNWDFDVSIRDGLTTNRWLPVAMANIEAFNTYAGGINGTNRHYRLIEDITLVKPAAGTSNWTAIGTSANGFSGSFNGNGYILQNLTINRANDNQGMFGVTDSDGIIQNVALVAVDINGSNSIGGIAGTNNGTIQSCYATGSIIGGSDVGGISGMNNGTIINCYTTSNVTGSFRVGGITGIINGNAECCYSTGKINGVVNTGGLAGYVSKNAWLYCSIALNSMVTSDIKPVDIGRVAGSVYNLDINPFSCNYARADMIVKKDLIDDNSIGIDGESIQPNHYTSYSWYTHPPLWRGDSETWNFSTIWQMNENNLLKLKNAGGSQNHNVE